MRVRLSARKSDLARLQAYAVGDALRAAHAGLEIEYLFKESLGDKNLTDPLWKIPERGVFTEDFVGDLLEGRTDLVVHSWKDLPTEPRPGLELLGTLPRADVRDLFLLRRDSFGKKNLTLLTSSPRRTFSAERELPALLPFPVDSLATKPVRGNVLTRLKKLVAGEGDGLFMAKAALDRLLTAPQAEFAPGQKELRDCLEKTYWMVLPLSLFPTAPAQGALAIEAKAGREDLRSLVGAIHCEATARSVARERKVFSSFGGGCHQKIGLTVQEHARLGTLEFFYGSLDSGEVRHTLTASAVPAFEPGLSRWPLEPGPAFFRREPVTARHPGTDLFIARADALPEEWEPVTEGGKRQGQLVWCAGLESWKKLSQRGVWVHGSFDGLGESPLEGLSPLANRPVSFTKLTHDASENDGLFPVLATYQLKETGFMPPLAETYFWMSASSFGAALKARPEIREKRHATGPGFTAEAIERVLGRPPEVYINYRHWRNGDPFGKE